MHKGFHIHVDACEMTEAFGRRLEQMGFAKAPFVAVEERSFAPEFHYTLKPSEEPIYKSAFNGLKELWTRQRQEGPAARGFIEGECIAFDEILHEGIIDESIDIPFQVQERELDPGEFRESEIHITMNRDASNTSLQKKLLRMGFYLAANVKAYGVAHIFTIQGTRKQIRDIWPPTLAFIKAHGGAVNGKIKEERIIDWWTSDGGVLLPPVIARVDFASHCPS